MALDPTWEAKAGAWARFARSPEHDHFFWLFNGHRFLELIPEPGRCTLDLACGEGRLGRLLGQRGHRVVAVDGAPTMGRLAHEAGGQLVVVGDAGRESRPWPWRTRHTGLELELPGIHRPLEAYTTALEREHFVIEAIREPRPVRQQVSIHPESERWLRIPCFLHLRAVRS